MCVMKVNTSCANVTSFYWQIERLAIMIKKVSIAATYQC